MANTINCPVCGKLTDSRLDSCPHCGAYLKSRREQARAKSAAARPAKSCPRCGASVQEGDIICVSCGTNLLTGQRIVDEAALRKRRRLPWGWIAGVSAVAVVVLGVAGLWIYAAGRDPLSQARRLAAEGNTLAAENVLEDYVERVQDDVPALLELGRIQWRNNKYGEAATTFMRASRLAPANEDAAVWAAWAVARSGATGAPEFVEILGRAAELRRDDPGLWYVLALARGVKGDYAGEVDALNRVMELRATDDSARMSLGVARALSGDPGGAQRDLLTVAAGPRNGDALAALGFIASMRGDTAQADRRFSEALATGDFAFTVDANIALGRLRLQQGAYEEAQARLEQALNADPANRQARFLHGLCLQARGRFQDAVAQFEQLSSEPGAFAAEAAVQAADVHLKLNAPDRARRALDDASRAGAKDAAYYTVSGRLALLADDLNGAMDAFAMAIRTDPNYAGAYLERGLLNVRRDATGQGLADLDRYLALVGEGGRGSRIGDIRALADQLRQTVNEPMEPPREANV